MSKGIKFRGNIKVNLLPLQVGEVVYAVDTQQWGLCVNNNGTLEFLWRTHENEENIHSGTVPPTSEVGTKFDYYIDLSTNKIYQKDSNWVEIQFPVEEAYFNNFVKNPFAPDYSRTIRKDGLIPIDRTRFLETPKTITPKNSCKLPISPDGVEKFCDNSVTDLNGALYINARVLISPLIDLDNAEKADLIWDNGLKFAPEILGHIRYYTTGDLKFSILGVKSPTNGYIDIISNDEIYPIYGSNYTAVTKIEVLSYGDRTSWEKLAYTCQNLTEFVISATDESKVTTFQNAWYRCTSLTSFPSLDTSSGTNFSFAWYGCSSLPSCPGTDETVTIPAGADTTNMCYGI